MLIGNGKVLRLYSDGRAALPLLEGAVHSHFPIFLHSKKRETGNCSFTAALIGGKVDFPVFLRSERTKSGNFSFTAAVIGGEVDFPVFLLSEKRETEIAVLPPLSSAVKQIFQFSSAQRGGKLEIADMLWVHVAEIFQSDFFIISPVFSLLVGHGSGLSSTKMKDGHV
ncbi:hypothetical protein AAC387_Pa02g0308 [Persea americana]